MITKVVWENLLYTYFLGCKYTTGLRVMICLILSILTIPLDTILLPFEIIAFIISIFL